MSDVRGVVASVAVTVGCGGLTYCAIGDQSVDRSVRGVTRFVGPVRISTGALSIGLAVATVIGIAGALSLAWWVRARSVRRGWVVVAFGGCVAATVSAWSWRVLTASYEVVGSVHLWLAVAAALAAWTVLLVRAGSYVRSFGSDVHRCRGCGYCAEQGNVVHGDVHMVSADEVRHTMLLRCPRCGWLYAATAAQPELVEPISEARARELFPSSW